MNTTDPKARRAALVAKVKALLAKTVANGCTEEEALSAAALAGKLMEQHDLEYEDVEKELRDERYGVRRRPFGKVDRRGRQLHHEVSWVCNSIAVYFDCRTWFPGEDLVYFGSADDTEMAHHMTVMLRLAMDSEWAAYLKSANRDPHVNGRTLRAAFMAGMRNRLVVRLLELKAQRTANAAPTTGTALVVVKTAIVAEHYATYARENNHSTRTTRSSNRSVNRTAYEAGKAAGDRVNLAGGKLGGGAARLGSN